ncbi:hypothetical protein BDW22DRAFT_1344863 [Trametopsis cervina]|nr:hypothetical protein BDW22DRAFT_1344863 [Trametopsis cervina]
MLRIASTSSLHSTPSLDHALPSPSPSVATLSSSASSSRVSLNHMDEGIIKAEAEEFRVCGTNGLFVPTKFSDGLVSSIRILATSTNITELSYSISDIQTRIFEIQELRHKSQSGDTSDASRVIDQSLVQLDERLEAVSQGIKAVNESLEPLLQAASTPTTAKPHNRDPDEDAALLRKHAAMISEWEAVQKESQVLREELKEDKWLTVFRTVTDQADGMMSSLEKAINRCQDFVQQMRNRGHEDSLSQTSSMSSLRSEKAPLNLDVFNTLSDSYEAKKKHYMPATTKVLSIIDKGVQDRVTKNGECLRRHAECNQRWKNLRERIARTDKDMDAVRKYLLALEASPSDGGSSGSGITTHSRGVHLSTTPHNQGGKHKSPGSSTLSRSMSPFRKLARKIKKSHKSPAPETPPLPKLETRMPSSEPVRTLKHRSSLFNLMSGQPPLTPERPTHKYSQSLTPDSSPVRQPDANSTLKSNRPAWNSSTRVEEEARNNTLKGGSQRRPSSSMMMLRDQDERPPLSSVNGTSPYRRSLSRSSMASSRPWSPVTSSVSTAHSSTNQPLASLYRPPSRSHAPLPVPMTPRSRPKTPSHIPRPSQSHFRSMSASPSPGGLWDDEDSPSSMIQRAFSPNRAQTPSGHPPRPPSRSMIPLPSVQISGASRPSSAMSNYGRPESSMSFRASSKTPDILRSTPRPSILQSRMPPSSFKDASGPRTPGRPPSRTGAATPNLDGNGPLHPYTPTNPKDPLDAEVAAVANSMSHGLLIERVDPPLRNIPREGEEVRAAYAFSNHLARKVVNCKLTTLARRENVTKKVMCRVGGGWQDLHVYIANRQAGTA